MVFSRENVGFLRCRRLGAGCNPPPRRLGAASDDEVEVIRLVLREALLVPASPRFAKLLSRFRQGHFAVLLQTLAEGVNDGELDGSVPLPLLMISTFAMGRRSAGHPAHRGGRVALLLAAAAAGARDAGPRAAPARDRGSSAREASCAVPPPKEAEDEVSHGRMAV